MSFCFAAKLQMDFYGVDTCRELGLPCLQTQTITDTPVSPGWPPVTKRSTIWPPETETLTATSSKSSTHGPTTMSQTITLRNIVEGFSTFSSQEGCFSNDVEDKGDDSDESSQHEQLAMATTLPNVSYT